MNINKGSFKNYVDKLLRWVGGQKMPILVHVQGDKNAHVEVGRWSKKGKIMST